MKQKLEALGWKMYYECDTCGGKQQFNHESYNGYEIRAKKRTNTFSILLNNHVIAGPFWNYQLEEKLKKHVHQTA